MSTFAAGGCERNIHSSVGDLEVKVFKFGLRSDSEFNRVTSPSCSSDDYSSAAESTDDRHE